MMAALAYFFWPREANLRAFDPAAVGRLETAMWQDYYEREYFALFRGLYTLSRREYGFSPWDSVLLSFYAAKAAAVFQPTRTRAEAQNAIPILEQYYGVIRRSGGERFAVPRAAQLELDWWQLRRENSTPAQYGEVIAQAITELYGVSNTEVKQAALLRAEMMRYRDERRDRRMETQDWAHIEEGLVRSYQLLKAGVNLKPVTSTIPHGLRDAEPRPHAQSEFGVKL